MTNAPQSKRSVPLYTVSYACNRSVRYRHTVLYACAAVFARSLYFFVGWRLLNIFDLFLFALLLLVALNSDTSLAEFLFVLVRFYFSATFLILVYEIIRFTI
jgi:hypothetical protein